MHKTTKLHIEGMSCGNCQRHAQEALSNVPGVVKARVDLDSKEACVEHDETVTLQQLIEAVAEEGYEASLIAGNAQG